MNGTELTGLLDRLRSLPPKKRHFLEQRLAEKGIDVGELGILPRLGPRDFFPMSHTQERLWFLGQLDPESTAYNIWSFHELPGRLDFAALSRAVREIVRRHETLRSNFASRNGELVQRVHRRRRLELPRIDLGALGPSEREAEARRLREVERRLPFDLERGPLLRLALVELDREDHVLLVTFHHIISDAWSIGVFQRELDVLYRHALRGPGAGPAPLPALAVQYGDFAHWQRTWQQPRLDETQLAYWKSRLAGAPAHLELPTDRPRPAVQTYGGGSVDLSIPAPVAARLKALGRELGATLFMTLLASFKALLLRLTNEDDLCVGMAVAGRNREELEHLIGFFVNTLVLRTGLGGNPGYREAIARVRRVVIAAQDHQDLSFARLVEALQPQRSLSFTPLFQVNFAMVSTPIFESGESWNRLDSPTRAALFDLELQLLERGSGEVTGWLYYNTALFDPTTVLRMRRHWLHLFVAMLRDPDRGIWDCAVLAPAERFQLLAEQNDRGRDDRRTSASLPGLFAARAAAAPDAAAVAVADRWLTYGELERGANRLANRLRELGVAPEVRVGLCLERSADQVVAILATLKAGGAYVPLDPDDPQPHLARLVDDAKASLVLTRGAAGRQLAGIGARVACLDAETAAIARQSPASPGVEPDPAGAAYVIFTSGSTGRPKGVVVSHENVVRLFAATGEDFGFGPRDVWTLFHSYAFDFSVWELFGALLHGGRLVIVPHVVARAPDELHRLLLERGVTVLNQTPSAFRQLLGAGGAAAPEALALRLVIFGGEALELAPLAPWLERRGGPRLVNMYGITETTVHVTVRPLERADLTAPARSPIGRALADLEVCVSDPRGRPAPVGVAGELQVGGAGLARGYLDRPRRTGARFVPSFLGRRPGERLYRSGDRARVLPGGSLDYLGRIDHQVKIRGFRIEPGEIEAALARCPQVRQAVVVAHGKAPARLVAYVVPAGPEAPSVSDLRRLASGLLPGHRVPSVFVLVGELPLTRTGKVDRAALARRDLPAPVDRRGPGAAAAPETPTEKVLAAVWSRVLGVEPIGVHDNFFELGGDSILSIQIVARAAQLGLALSPRQFFQHQTIAELAAVAGAGRAVEAEQGPVTGPVVLTPAQQWFFEQDLAERHHFNQAVLLRLLRPVSPAVWRRAVAAITAHHDAFRLRFERTLSGWRQASAGPEGEAPFGLADLSGVEAARQAALIESAAARLQTSLHLGRGPLLRVAVFDLGPGRGGRLLAVAHHLAVDGVSWRILLDDLETVVRQLEGGGKPALPPKTTSFRQWGERLGELACSGVLEREREYWTDERRSRAGRLPLDEPAAASARWSARTHFAALGAEETEALLREVPKAYRTQIHEVLLAGLLEVMARWIGSRGLLVELEGHGREEGIVAGADLSRTVGWFTVFFPLLLEMPEAPGPGNLLKAVKETLRNVPNRGIGYGLLRYLSGDGDTARRLESVPRPEISFNYLGNLDQALPESSLFAGAPESAGPAASGRQALRYLLEINCSVSGDRLTVAWTFGARLRPATVERLAEGFLEALRGLLRHCRSPEAGGYTPSDFPLARLAQPALDRLLGGARGIDDVYPLSPTQQGMLFFSLYDPASQAYRVQSARRLAGSLDAAALREAFVQMVRQHSVLRTSFAWEGLDEPLQIVHETAEVPWESEDWRELSEAEQEERLERCLAADRERGFDLSRAPLLRMTLVRLADEVHVLNWTLHHIVSDGWSGPLLYGELAARYAAIAADRPLRWKRQRPYRDYVAWLTEQDPRRAEDFWRGQLAGFRRPISLGLTPATTGVKRGAERFGKTPRILTAETSARLRQLMAERRLTSNTLVQALWALLLGRFSGRRDVVFGATVSGRSAPLAGIEAMVGLFINTLPVRARLDFGARFQDWGRELQEVQAAAREHEHTPLWKIQKWSDVPASLLLFESIVVFENYPTDVSFSEPAEREDPAADESAPPAGGRGVVATVAQQFERTSYPFTLIVVPVETGWFFEATVDLRVFELATAERMVSTLQTLLEGAAARPDGKLGDLPVLSAAERRQVLVAWNDTGREAPGRAGVLELFAAQAERTPDRIAVVLESRRLSYRRLDRRSDRLAAHLRSLGVGPEERVALFVERRPETVVGLLAVMKAGGAYLPLEPRTPRERLAFFLDDAGVRWVLTQDSLRSALPPSPRRTVVCLDLLPAGSAPKQPPAAAERNLAYLIYTSGSTGRPKAVAIEHRSLTDYCLTAAEAAGLGEGDRVLQFASASFDTSAEEIYPCLIRGATLVLRTDAMLDFSLFLEACLDRRLTVLDLPTAYWRELTRFLDSYLRELPPAVRLVILGGEKAEPEAVAAWHRNVGEETLLVNTYGPTESTIVVTQHPLAAAPVPRETAAGPVWPEVPIGRPRANVRAYVLDPWLEPAAPGMPGVLHLAGSGLARGYWRRPAATAEAFVPDPFGAFPGERLYATGDRTRYREDGVLEFLGRGDHQVKLRGFRVELGEVEAALRSHPAVREAVAWVREEGGRRLMASFVAERRPAPEPAELRAHLRKALPEHMVPAILVESADLPRLASGKVDRAALAALAGPQAAPREDCVPPRDGLERRLLGLWEKLFEHQPIGVLDDFFESGGDSIVALRLLTLLREELGASVPLAALFERRTVADLADLLRRESAGPRAATPLVVIQPNGANVPVFFVHPAGGNVLCYEPLSRHLGREQPFYGLQAVADGADEGAAPTVEERAERYVRAVLEARPQGPYALGGWSVGGVIAFEMARQLASRGRQVPFLALLDTLTPAILPAWEGADLVVTFSVDVGIRRLATPSLSLAAFRELDLERQLDHVLERARDHGLLPRQAGRAEIHRLWRTFEAVVRSVQRYAPGTYPGRALLLRAGEEPAIAPAGADLGWGPHVAGGLDVEWVPGRHQNMVFEPWVHGLALRLTARLAALAGGEDLDEE